MSEDHDGLQNQEAPVAPRVVPFADHSDDCHTWTPEQCLQKVLDDLKSGAETADRAIVLLIIDGEGDGSRHLVKAHAVVPVYCRISSLDAAVIHYEQSLTRFVDCL